MKRKNLIIFELVLVGIILSSFLAGLSMLYTFVTGRDAILGFIFIMFLFVFLSYAGSLEV